MTDFKIGGLVRFANEQDGGPVHRIVSVMSDGMIELHDFGGYFAPHLFVEATDIAGIPPAPSPQDLVANLRADLDEAVGLLRRVPSMAIASPDMDWKAIDLESDITAFLSRQEGKSDG